MATSGSIGDLFVLTLVNTTSEQTTKTIAPGRVLTVELITIVMTAGTGGTSTFQFLSDRTGSAGFVDMFGGAVATKANNVNLNAQSAGSGDGSLQLVPTGANQLTSASGQLRLTVAGANASYVARFYCSAENPAVLPVV